MLIRRLFHFDSDEKITFLNELNIGEYFLSNGKQFKIVKKRRTRYLCTNLVNNRQYLVSGAAKVERVEL